MEERIIEFHCLYIVSMKWFKSDVRMRVGLQRCPDIMNYYNTGAGLTFLTVRSGTSVAGSVPKLLRYDMHIILTPDMFLIGVTGGIASGKSTVCRALAALGCPIIDADLLAREVVAQGTTGWKKIKQHFGDEVLMANGELDRRKLGDIIFSNSEKRKVLNSITHPEIYKEMFWRTLKHFLKGEQFVVLDLPLLFESGYMVPYIKFIIVASCSKQQQIERLLKRNNLSQEEAEKRIQTQMPLEEKCLKATHIIDTSQSKSYTEIQVKQLHTFLKSSKHHWKIRLMILSCCSLAVGLGIYLLR